MRSKLWALLYLFISTSLLAQEFTTDQYYLFPINPGKQNFLAGTMGELRSSHFHAGLDIKTGGQSGVPVRATADGFISRIKVNSGGYGFALYMTHPNGTTSVYAHMKEFAQPIKDWVIAQQYEKETFEIQLFPERDQFTFKQGEIIGLSGNTGSSSGPHLHFEIRDANQRILDPLKFKFPEIKDNISPIMKNIAFVTLDGDARVNDTFGRFEFDVLKTNGTYSTRVPINLKGKIGMEIYAYDLLNGVYNRNGISSLTMLIDGDTIFSQSKTSLSFSKQRNILVHMDYQAYRNSGRKYNKLFVEDGNTNDFYTKESKGYRFDEGPHEITLHLVDSYDNISTFKTTVNRRKVVNKPKPKVDRYELFRNHLHFAADHEGQPNSIRLFLGSQVTELVPYRVDPRDAYYLWDLRDGLPDSIDYCGEMITTDLFGVIPSNEALSFYNHDVDLFFNQRSLFDTLYLRFEKRYDSLQDLEIFSFPHADVPLKSSVKVRLKTEKNYPDSTAAVYGIFGNKLGGYQGGTWDEEGILFTTRDLVSFTIAEDTIPPTIDPRIINRDELYFKIRDDRSGIKSFRATLNGEFVLMQYEYKRNLIWAVKKDENISFSGEFILEVTDQTGNQSIYQKTLP